MRKLTLFFILAALAACNPAHDYAEKCFYVSVNGDDNADGSRKHPWATPVHAIQEACNYSCRHNEERTTILFDGGEYRIDSTIRLKNLTTPLRISAIRGTRPVFCGDAEIKGWKPDPKRQHVFKADLKACGINDFGNVIGRENRMDFYANLCRQEVARWPNGHDFSILGKALGPTVKELDRFPGEISHKEGIVAYTDSRMNSWAEEKEPYILAYWYWDWFEEYKIPHIDTVSRVITLEPDEHLYGYGDSARFFGLNLLCELDSPGEYYMDRASGTIYWYPGNGISNPEKADTRVSVFPGRYMLEVRECNGFSIEGISFRGGRGGAVNITGGRDNQIKDCRISLFGEAAVTLSGGSGHSIKGCAIRQLGASGILAEGGDRKTLKPSGFIISGNTVEDFALFKHTYEPAVRFQGAGATISHNNFSNSTSSAVSLIGNDIIVEYNLFSDLVKESDDQGALESFGDLATRRLTIRYNHWRNINGGTRYGAAAVRFDDLISGNLVYGNLFENCGSFRFGAVQIHGGKDNIIEDNLFYRCNFAVSCSPWTFEVWRKKCVTFKDRWKDIDLCGELYTSRYPELLEQVDSTNNNRNYVRGNLIVGESEPFRNGDFLQTENNTRITESIKPLRHYLRRKIFRKRYS